MNNSALYRSRQSKIVGGVCGGLAEKLSVDPVVIRLIFALMLFIGGTGLLAYIILWIILPERPYSFQSNAQGTAEGFESNQYDDLNQKEIVVTEKPVSKGSLIAGIVLIGLGGLFLLAAFIPRLDIYDLWPVVLIVFGIILLRPTEK